MRERRYSSEEVQEQAQKIINDLKKNTDEWRKMPYRYISLFCGVPLRSAQPILIRLRAHPNIEYKYQQTSVRIPTAICHYVEADKNSITYERFAQFEEDTYAYLYHKIGEKYDVAEEHEDFMLLMILAEQLLLNGFQDNWCDLPPGYYAIMMGLETDTVVKMVKTLEDLHIIKRLGISRMYRIALSEEEYEALANSAYAKQQEDILERSKRLVAEEAPEEPDTNFTVLTELNAVAEAAREMLERSYQINENIVRQQLVLRNTVDALKALREKENVYAGMAVRINAISKNYEDAVRRSHDAEARNNELKHLLAQNDKFFADQRHMITENLESMLGMVLSAIEEYFSLPLHEKNRPSNVNRTKTNITRIIMDTIQAIEKGKLPQ